MRMIRARGLGLLGGLGCLNKALFCVLTIAYGAGFTLENKTAKQ